MRIAYLCTVDCTPFWLKAEVGALSWMSVMSSCGVACSWPRKSSIREAEDGLSAVDDQASLSEVQTFSLPYWWLDWAGSWGCSALICFKMDSLLPLATLSRKPTRTPRWARGWWCSGEKSARPCSGEWWSHSAEEVRTFLHLQATIQAGEHQESGIIWSHPCKGEIICDASTNQKLQRHDQKL